eukprot:TRINITY_DN119_c0_g1_i21.p1 TRINITY_DN119_c0_g1~~TRINITY_DN119_c0_g1_i21.p1  ORF type:complete len:241 (+),score=66.03 TRINITY_DN119_c0_g1_i21:103-825(+)
MMKVAMLVGLLIVGVGAQYGTASAAALAVASIDDIVGATALAAAAASATGDDATASAAAAATANGDSASAFASASASVGADDDKDDEEPLTKQIKGLPHSKVVVVPVKKIDDPVPKTTPVIVITTFDEKTCEDILEDLLECADGSEDVPYECLEKSEVTIEDLVECGYLAPVPEPEPIPSATPTATPSPVPSPTPSAVPELAPVEEPCTDNPPDAEYTCAEIASFGRCDGDFCLKSCGKC